MGGNFLKHLVIASLILSSYSFAQSPGAGFEPGPGGVLVPPQCGESLTYLVKEAKIYSADLVEKNMAAQNDDNSRAIKKFYQQMLERGENRDLYAAPNPKAFEQLKKEAPNLVVVAQDIQRAAGLSLKAGEPMQFPPILLVGPPGIGKTNFAQRLGQIVGSGMHRVDMGATTGSMVISGNSSQWRGGKPGKVAQAMVNGKVANPVILVDEVDKASVGTEYDPLGAFYSLLEPETAREFTDEFVDVPIDTSNVLWIATANDMSKIPGPILDRLEVYEIKAPTEQEMWVIIHGMYEGLLAQHKGWKFQPTLKPDVVNKLVALHPRAIRKAMIRAVGVANEAGRDYLIPGDIQEKVESKKQPIGFTRP